MRRPRRRALLASLAVLAWTGPRAAAQQTALKLGTAMEGGGVATYGAALMDAIALVDPGLEIRGVTTKGILDNVALLEADEIDIGLVFGEVTHDLFAGVGRAPTKLRIVSVMYSTPGMFVVRAESRYRAISDLTGRPVVWNGRNSGLAVQARYVMDGLGLDLEKDFQPVYTTRLGEGPQLLIDGHAVALWGAGHRWPGFVTVANTARGARFVVPNADEIRRIRAKHPFIGQFTVRAGLYPGQYDPITTVGSWSFILARAGLDDAVGFRLAKALHRIEKVSLASKQLAESTAQRTLDAIASPDMLHPGVARYYGTIGLIR